MRVVQLGCDSDFAQKPLGPETHGNLGPKHLDGDWTAVP
jgi:hypothetical protein